ncbi:MAG TPA: hypothetical protein VMA54_15100 [Steroidobacteraceae bacterium]|nr:hypothetical protein [Steroidobacteraceae bacterium]
MAERAVRRPEREMVPPPFFTGVLEREEGADLADPGPDADGPEEPSAAALALCDAAELGAADPEDDGGR